MATFRRSTPTADGPTSWPAASSLAVVVRSASSTTDWAVTAHSAGIKLIGATLTPFGNETFMANAWNPIREKHRVAVNAWIRESGAFDGIADFDAALHDPNIPTQVRAVDDCGDGLHPSD